MNPILHPIFALLASVTRQELARQVAYLKEENRILRARLPERLVATPEEKRRLQKFGRKLGVQLVAPRSSPAKSSHSRSAVTIVWRTRVFSLARRRLFLRAEVVLGWFVVRHKAASRRLRREEAVDGWLESPSTDDAHLRC
jgi:hypothetical protein